VRPTRFGEFVSFSFFPPIQLECWLVSATLNLHLCGSKQVPHLLIEQVRVVADVERPRPQLAPVVDGGHPPFRRRVFGLVLVIFEAFDLQRHSHAA